MIRRWKKGTNLNRKDEIFSDLAKLFKTSRVDFSSTTEASDGFHCLQVLNILFGTSQTIT